MLGSRKKTKLPKYNTSTITTKLLNPVRMGEGEFKYVGCWKEQAIFEKEDEEEVEDGK